MNGEPLGGQFFVSTVALAQPERARRLQSRPARVPGRRGTTPASTPTCTRSGGASSATAAGGAPQFTGRRFLHRRSCRRRQRRAGDGRGVRVHARGASSSPTTRSDRPRPTSSRSWSTTPATSSAVRRRCRSTTTGSASRASPTTPAATTFMVAWGVFYNPAGPGAVHVRTVSASTGALGPVREIATGTAVYVPQVEYNDSTGQFFVAWYTQPSIWGRTLAPDGTPVGGTSLVAYNYASYDGLGLSYNPVANTYFAVFHGRGSRGRRRPGVGGRRARRRVHRDRDAGHQRQLQPAHHVAHRPPRMARRHLVELRPDHRPARALGWRRAAAPAAAAAAPAAAAAAAADRASS